MFSSILLSSLLVRIAYCSNFLLPEPQGVTRVDSKVYPGAKVSWKEPKICETTPGVKSFSGYVHLPADAGIGQNYDANIFYWFFEARKNPKNAPVVVWLGGGPGTSSLAATATESGPCFVNSDSNSTTPNPYSWNNEANVIYIDQPVHTGFSYDTLTNGLLNLTDSSIIPYAAPKKAPQDAPGYIAGTFGSQGLQTTANTTTNAAAVTWKFLQAWLDEYGIYCSGETMFNLWTESFGGKYGPTFAAYFQNQSKMIRAGHGSGKTPIDINVLGIVNGCSDIVSQGNFYPEQAYNNTYDFNIINTTQYKELKQAISGLLLPGVDQCRDLERKLDPYRTGANNKVNEACTKATGFVELLEETYKANQNRDLYDMRQYPTTSRPAPYLAGYFNRPWVQSALGVPVNYTQNSQTVLNAFVSTGDAANMRGGTLEDYNQVLESGTRVAMMYGDRDFLCNWLGGENISANIGKSKTEQFRKSGYQQIQVNGSYVGGLVRQSGSLSFSRVFEAGHEAPSYQPETAYQIFMRTLKSLDVATGKIPLTGKNNAGYQTSGPSSSLGTKNKGGNLGPIPPECYIYNLASSCTPDQQVAVLSGTANIKDFIVVSPPE